MPAIHVRQMAPHASAGLAVAIVGIAAILLACSTTATLEAGRVFAPYVANSEARFRVIDRRSEAVRKGRTVESAAGTWWYYGDDQFQPSAATVVASRFAQAFPAAPPETLLEIENLEVRYQPGWFPYRGGCMGSVVCVLEIPIIAVERQYSAIPPRLMATLAGKYEGRPFSATYVREFGELEPFRFRPESDVLEALQRVIDQAIGDVRNGSSSAEDREPGRDDEMPPALSRPWYMPTPSQLQP
jgi:hypothetical protein